MAKKKKNDFWDDPDDFSVVSGKDKEKEEWSPTKSTPLKLLMRLFLMVACFVAVASALVAYQYVSDRRGSGSYSRNFFDSKSFAVE